MIIRTNPPHNSMRRLKRLPQNTPIRLPKVEMTKDVRSDDAGRDLSGIMEVCVDEMKISVIVPVYNTLHCLERCVDSICGQTFKDLEIILVDDGSTDGTGRQQLDQKLQRRSRALCPHNSERTWLSGLR